MPNWCDNTLYITGSALKAKALRTKMISEASKFDFNAIIAMPHELRGTESSSNCDTAWELKYGVWEDWHSYGPKDFATREEALEAARRNVDWGRLSNRNLSFDELADRLQSLKVRHGHYSWYSWSVANWGTKWPAWRAGWMSPERALKRDAEQVAYFTTAWDPPIPVIDALSTRFKTLILRLAYQDIEGGVSGFFTIKNGKVLAEKHEEWNYEAEDGVGSVHRTHEPCEVVYIGNGHGADSGWPAFPRSTWANPFATLDLTPTDAVKLYRRWLVGDADVNALLPPGVWKRPSRDEITDQLLGKTLLCDCDESVTEACPARVLADLVFGRDEGPENEDNDERDADYED